MARTKQTAKRPGRRNSPRVPSRTHLAQAGSTPAQGGAAGRGRGGPYLENEIVLESSPPANDAPMPTPDAVENSDIALNMVNCVMCVSKIRDTVTLPCMHFSMCFACSTKVVINQRGCPICGVPIEERHQIYFSRAENPLFFSDGI